MESPSLVEVWEFDSDLDAGEVARFVLAGGSPPSFYAIVLSAGAGVLTVQVARGAATGDADALFYLRGLGVFSLARREEWPALAARQRPRVLLTLLSLGAHPSQLGA